MSRYVALLLIFLTIFANARDFSGYMMETNEGLRLAATAAPRSVSDDASYYLFSTEGFELHSKGSNGWHCFVERALFLPSSTNQNEFDPRIRAPHCINEEGAATRMQEVFMRTRLALDGLSREEIGGRINAAFAAGELRSPKQLAMTYMMSPEQWLGEGAGHWHPHLMFWLPYLENADAGGNPELGVLPFVTSGSGTRSAVLVIAVEAYE